MKYIAQLRELNPQLAPFSDDQIIAVLPQIDPNRFGNRPADEVRSIANMTDREFEVKQYEDAGGGIGSSVERGLLRANQSFNAAGAWLGDTVMGMMPDSVRDSEFGKWLQGEADTDKLDILRDQASLEALPVRPEMMRAITAANNADTGVDAVLAFAREINDSPNTIGFMLDTFAEQSPQILTQILGTKGAGALIGGTGKASQILRMATGGGTSSGVATLGSNTAQYMEGDIANFDEAIGKAAKRSGAQALVDAATAGAIPVKIGPNQFTNVLAQSGLQAGGGALGEYAGATAVGEQVETGELVAEGLLELISAPGDVVSAVMDARRKPMQAARAKIQQAGEEAAAAGGDPLDQEIAKAKTAVDEIPKATEARNKLDDALTAATQQIDPADYETPAMNRERATGRGFQGLDGLITLADRLPDGAEDAARLRKAKDLFQKAEAARAEGRDPMASMYARQGNKLYQAATETNEVLREQRANFPVPYVAQGEIAGGELAVTDQPNWTTPEPDIGGTAQRVTPQITSSPQNLPPGTGQINMGRERPDRTFTPAPTEYEGVGRNVVERQSVTAPALPQGSALRTITADQLQQMQQLRREALRTKARERTPEQVEALQITAAVRAGEVNVEQAPERAGGATQSATAESEQQSITRQTTEPTKSGVSDEKAAPDAVADQLPVKQPVVKEAATSLTKQESKESQLTDQPDIEYPFDEAVAAHGGTSHRPRVAAQVRKEWFENAVEDARNSAAPLAETDVQRVALEGALTEFKREYLSREVRALKARSSTVSSNIAGRSKFNSKQAGARGSALDRAEEELSKWIGRGKAAVKQAVLSARSPEQLNAEAEKARSKQEKRNADRRAFMRKIMSAKKGDKIAGDNTFVRLNNGRDGYPKTFTFANDGVIKGIDDKIDIARELYKGDVDALRSDVDAIIASDEQQDLSTDTTESAPDKMVGKQESRNEAQRNIYDRNLESITDIEEARRYIDDLRREALTDERTGLGSNRAWVSREPKTHVASIDLDSLKWVNDNMGHPAGDRMIELVGDSMRAAGIAEDAYHISGDEFYAQSDDAKALAESLAEAQRWLKSQTISGNGISYTGPGFSFGIDKSVEAADVKLQSSKAKRAKEGARAERGETPAGVVMPRPERYARAEEAPASESVEQAPPQQAEMSRDDVERIAKDISSGWTNPPQIKVVESDSEFPEIPRRNLEKSGEAGKIQGMFYRGTVYLVSDRLNSEADVQRFLFHEALGHYGLRELYGPKLGLHLDQLWSRIGGLDGVRRLQKKYGFDLEGYWDNAADWDPAHRREMMADELIAHIASTGEVEPTLMQKIANLIRQGLRKLFGDRFPGLNSMTDGELLQVVADARNAVVKGKGSTIYPRQDADYDRNFDDAMYARSGGVADLKNELRERYPSLRLDMIDRGDILELSRIELAPSDRNKGAGTEIMGSIVDWADANGKVIALSPSGDFGGNKVRLKEFYKRFGFVENKGRKRDYAISESMYRPIPDEERYARTDSTTPEESENPYDKAFSALGNKDKTVWQKAKRQLKREFKAGGLLPDSVYQQKIVRDSELNAMEFDIAHYVGALDRSINKSYGKSYKNLTDEQREAINDQMGATEPNESIPEDVRGALMKMRHAIRSLSRDYADILQNEIDQLSESGNAEEALEKAALLNTILQNLDTYAHRSYRAFDDKDWPKKVGRDVYDAAARYLEQRYAESGLPENEIQTRVARTIKTILEEGTAYDGMESFIKESKLGAKDLSVLKKRKEIAPEIRALLGEYKDVKVNFSKTLTKMSRLVVNQKFLDRIKQIGLEQGFLFTEENKPIDESVTRIAAEGSEVYAPLNGYYTYSEIDQAFRDVLGKEQMADWYRTIVRMNGMIKYGKTILSPTTAMRNWMSASFFAMANGHFDISQMRKSLSGLREYFKHDGNPAKIAYLRKLKELGVIYDTPYAGEMMDLLADSNLENSLFDKGPFKSLKAANDVAQKFYQYGDDFWKILGFENEKAMLMKYKNMSEAEAEVEAAERIRNTYPTYSMTGKFVQHLRRFPLAGTFVSFPAEIIRTTYHMLRYLKQDMRESPAYAMRKIAGLAVASGFAFAIQALTKDLFDIDDEEEEAVRTMAAPWQQNSNLAFIGRDDDGNLRYFDISFLDPYNYWKRPINAVMREQPITESLKQSVNESLSPFFGQDIAFGTIMEIFNNRKESGGRIFNPADTTLNQAIEIGDHLRKNLQPGFASNIERTYRAMRGEVTRSGRQYNLNDELMALGGWRVTTFDPKTALYYRSFEFQDTKRDASSVMLDIAKDPNKVSDSELMDAYDTARRARFKAYQDMIRIVEAAKRSGMSRIALYRSLKNSGISKADITALIDGRIPDWRLDKRMLRNTIRKAELLYGPGVVQEMKRREQMLIRESRQE